MTKNNQSKIRIGSLNCRSLNKYKKRDIAEDMNRHNLIAIATQETKLKGKSSEYIKAKKNKKQKLIHYFSGTENAKENHYGVGILVKEETIVDFTPIDDRICKAVITMKDGQKIVLFSVLAPTLKMSETTPKLVHDFYDKLDQLVKQVSNRDLLVIAGDFNAKTGDAYEIYSKNMGKFGLGKANSNGYELLNFATKNDLILTNTKFNHNLSQRVTWESPEKHTKIDIMKITEVKPGKYEIRNIEHREVKMKITGLQSGDVKCHINNSRQKKSKPTKNQIDYILVRTKQFHMITDSRSYNEFKTSTDHRLVIMSTKIKTFHPYSSKGKAKRIDFDKMNQTEYQEKFHDNVQNKMRSTEKPEETQERWTRIAEISKEAAIETLGYKEPKGQKSENEVIKRLSEEQLKLKNKIEGTQDQNTRVQLKRDRNVKLRQIKAELNKEEEAEIIIQVEEIEKQKDDSRRMFTAARSIKRKEPKRPLLLEQKDENGASKGMTTNEEVHVKLISEFFEEMFNDPQAKKIFDVNPVQMRNKFTTEEIKTAVKSLRKNKAPGTDEIRAEQIKYGPDEVHHEIAEILNEMAATGIKPNEITVGILTAHQKPKKKAGPLSHLQPIILLSILRKLLAICMIKRVGERVLQKIPKTQTAYQGGRSTTEQVFVFRSLAEKAISSKDYTVHAIMMDMSRAFDTVDRNKLMLDLAIILEEDELHIMKLMIEDVQFVVRCGQNKGKPFVTNIGTPQGDCLSPILFILYLANALKNDNQGLQNNINKEEEKRGDTIDEQYADDIGWVTNGPKQNIEELKASIPLKLEERGLLVNREKDEEFSITYKGNEEWKNVLLLGSLIDTKQDFKRRKMLSLVAIRTFDDIWCNKRISLKVKLRNFKAFVESISLYNSELWTVSKKMQKDIDSFQRRLLRYVLNIRYPKKISNERLKAIVKQKPWSEVIKVRRIKWLGHLFRLPEESAAKRTLYIAEKEVSQRKGRKILTWLNLVKGDLKELGVDWEVSKTLAQDRKRWQNLVNLLI